MQSAADIAKYFISLGNDEDSGDLISNLKLQKLLYYAQGVHLAIHGEPLFREQLKAWAHGPVVPDVYREYSQYGSGDIPPQEIDYEIFSDSERELMNEVFSVFGQFSAWKLRNMTHDEPPWKNTEGNSIISHEALKEYFSSQVVEQDGEEDQTAEAREF